MTSQTVQQIVTIHILSKSQEMKQSNNEIQNMRIIFLEQSHTKCVGEASLRTLYKNTKFSICLDKQSEML